MVGIKRPFFRLCSTAPSVQRSGHPAHLFVLKPSNCENIFLSLFLVLIVVAQMGDFIFCKHFSVKRIVESV